MESTETLDQFVLLFGPFSLMGECSTLKKVIKIAYNVKFAIDVEVRALILRICPAIPVRKAREVWPTYIVLHLAQNSVYNKISIVEKFCYFSLKAHMGTGKLYSSFVK